MKTIDQLFLILFCMTILVGSGFYISFDYSKKILKAQKEQTIAINKMLDTHNEFLKNLKVE